ncbi:MAG: ABC transporter permease [Lachnospiraceae bacterium]|nr:ABC transporter permease [Lachnospiraceae bacterium]
MSLHGINQVSCVVLNPQPDCRYAFYVLQNGKQIAKYPYQDAAELVYWTAEEGNYSFRVFVKENETEDKISKTSPEVKIQMDNGFYSSVERKKTFWDIFTNIGNMFSEIVTHWDRMIRISWYDYKVLNKDAYLGSIWNILNPLIQIATFWFVFGIGLKSGNDVDGYPFIVWLLCGMIPWFYVNACIVQGADAIRSKGISVLKMRYPIATMPLEAVLVCLYSHLVMIAILILTLLFFGVFPNWHWLNLLYYLVYGIVHYTALTTITSVLTMIALDVKKLITALIRMLFYLTPIVWSITRMPEKWHFILKLNPILYYVDGFRDSLLYQQDFFMCPGKVIFFWGINLFLIIVGANLQAKYKNRFLDME